GRRRRGRPRRAEGGGDRRGGPSGRRAGSGGRPLRQRAPAGCGGGGRRCAAARARSRRDGARERGGVSDLRPPESHGDGDRLRGHLEALQQLDVPLIVLVGGATGTGKSTVTSEVAYRLGITRVSSTDFVRQTMRAFFSHEFMPSIHYSSFE